MTDLAIGVPMFTREQALHQLLASVPGYVSTVYIADNGEDTDRDCYAESYPFDVHVLRLPYDCGIAQCRRAITDVCSETYLWVGDNDMAFTADQDLQILKAILDEHPDLGGVSGWLLEGNTVRAGARNLQRYGETVIKEAVDAPAIEHSPYPFARFDFIPQAGLFRTACFDDYNYDPALHNTEHLDFFVGHQQTDWEFASTPAVLIRHNRAIDQAYRDARGTDHADFARTAEKWGITDTAPGCRPDWGHLRDRTVPQQAFDVVKRVTPPRVWMPIKRGAKRVGLQ
jgi:hypothetical protein